MPLRRRRRHRALASGSAGRTRGMGRGPHSPRPSGRSSAGCSAATGCPRRRPPPGRPDCCWRSRWCSPSPRTARTTRSSSAGATGCGSRSRCCCRAFGGGFEVKATGGSSPFGSGLGLRFLRRRFLGDGGYPGTSGGGTRTRSPGRGLALPGAADGDPAVDRRAVPGRADAAYARRRAGSRRTALAAGHRRGAGPRAVRAARDRGGRDLLVPAARGARRAGDLARGDRGVLQRDDLAAWLAQRPAARSAVRALGTAVRALGAVVALCSLVGFVAYANADDVDGTALLIALPILPNIGFAVLGLSWGVPVKYDVQGQFSMVGSSAEHGSFGLPRSRRVGRRCGRRGAGPRRRSARSRSVSGRRAARRTVANSCWPGASRWGSSCCSRASAGSRRTRGRPGGLGRPGHIGVRPERSGRAAVRPAVGGCGDVPGPVRAAD